MLRDFVFYFRFPSSENYFETNSCTFWMEYWVWQCLKSFVNKRIIRISDFNIFGNQLLSFRAQTTMGTQNPYDFETFYQAVCADLQTKGDIHSMSKQFSLLGDDNERIKFVLEKNFAGSVHWKDFNFSPKDRSESQKLRNLGNQVYQKNRLSEALEYYSQSICLVICTWCSS